MAGNANSGRNATFHLSEKELAEKIEKYRAAYKAEEFEHMSAPHFYTFIGCLEREAVAFIEEYREDTKSIYYRRARMLEGFLQEISGEILSSGRWKAHQVPLARMHLEKDHGDGITYKETGKKQAETAHIEIAFAKGDPRAEDAAK